jgi:hypothetical protein
LAPHLQIQQYSHVATLPKSLQPDAGIWLDENIVDLDVRGRIVNRCPTILHAGLVQPVPQVEPDQLHEHNVSASGSDDVPFASKVTI